MYIVSQDRAAIYKMNECYIAKDGQDGGKWRVMHQGSGDDACARVGIYETKDDAQAAMIHIADCIRIGAPVCNMPEALVRTVRDEVIQRLEQTARCPEGALGESGQDPYEGLPKVAPRKSWYRGV